MHVLGWDKRTALSHHRPKLASHCDVSVIILSLRADRLKTDCSGALETNLTVFATLLHQIGVHQNNKELPWFSVTLAAVVLSYFTLATRFTKTGNAAFVAPFVGSKHAWLARWGFFQSAEAVIQEGHADTETGHGNSPKMM
ncbi:hypothetical protein T310_8414 [Rasamsonia emersonii CBS 393.64]|uniref:Uncharacterized protein n=1 Tax=Rasamsonia emersonii (strain ATCC 16479 / CBS 393.64 / IMI 116815) TaxID=1408163 RepID=A0A0F4YIH2_RASE3|nr:hypothetical protein T310_8414 [Rasamsonia emersonii CBS 393.64]KKA17646.1 hypothetical protein T310_8414 [Rasamsonia emersonii CBS 393.64]